MDYSKTVNLPKTDFPMKADLPRREPEWLKAWDSEQAYQKALESRQGQKGKKEFILHDGPPYANGHLHLGHALNKILKDIIVRYKTMTGHYAPYVPGWDCHGLPIELQLMKELGVDKHKIERNDFRKKAAAFAQKFVDIQRQEFKRMGILGDWDKPYLTMDAAYEQTIVDCFNQLKEKGYVYRGKKPVYWCSVDETALAEAEVEYEEDPGPSIFVAFPSAKDPMVSFVIWTTTPWTLPANRAIALHPDEIYVVFKEAQHNRQLIVAERRLDEVQKACGLTGQVMDRKKGSAFVGSLARHPWIQGLEVPILSAAFVAMDTGTGLVHIAPGHGMEDYQLGQANGLEVYSPLDDRGRFTDQVPEWKGVHVFKANPLIVEHLKSVGALLHTEEITHSYPHCWRCHKPVIFRATEQWFLKIDHEKLRGRLMQEIEKIDQAQGWIPAYGKNRIAGMVESRPDWCLSRQRYWGTEIPASGQAGADPDIVDVWFESGVSWAAVLKQRPELSYPADMYLEGSDQHRGWFQTSLIPSVALEGRAPFKAVLTHGFVMDGEGRPMSKSLGNVISPDQIIKQYGADVLRLWVGSSDYGGDVRLSPEILKGTAEAYRKVRNTLRYLVNNLTDFDPSRHTVPVKDLPEIDRWALHRLQEEIRDALSAYQSYQFHRVTSRLVSFCGMDLSSFYLDVLKDRLYCDPADSRSRRAAQTVLYAMADALIRLLAPIMSFTADEAWRFLGHKDNVASADLPSVDAGRMDPPLMDKWKVLLSTRELVLAELEKARTRGVVKAPREAKVILKLRNEEMVSLFKGYAVDLPSILGVSQADVVSVSSGDAVTVEIQKAGGAKCARCWIYKTDVGLHKDAPDLCGRCVDALEVNR